MWTSTIELSPRRVLLTRFLGQFWPGAYFSSFAPLQVQNLPGSRCRRAIWIRVRNRLAGIGRSDLHLISADRDFRVALAALPGRTRSYPGQEVVGEVIEVSEDVQRVKVGDRVALQYGQNCVSQGIQPLCRACAAGQYNLCEQRTFSGPQQIGGGWSEEMLLHESQVFRVPDELSDEQAVMIEPSAVALHAVLRRLPQPGEHVLIVGAGTIGLLVLQIVRALVPQATVSVLARYPFQVEQATRMGAEHIIYPQDTYQDVQQATGAKLYNGRMGNTMLLGGYDVIFDTIGAKRTLHDALRWTRAGGTIVIVGVSLHMMRIDLSPVWYQEVSLIGSMNHGPEQWPIGSQEHYSTFAIAAELMAQGLIHPEKLITHRFALTRFPQALSTAPGKERTRAIKVVFDYDKMPASVVPNVRSSARLRRRSASGLLQQMRKEHKISRNNRINNHSNRLRSKNQRERADKHSGKAWVYPPYRACTIYRICPPAVHGHRTFSPTHRHLYRQRAAASLLMSRKTIPQHAARPRRGGRAPRARICGVRARGSTCPINSIR